jgi:ribose transport system permease protein
VSKNSIQSTALEAPKGSGLLRRLIPVYGMIAVIVVLFVIFSILKPDTFPTMLNFRILASGNATLFILALAVTLPMVVGKIDLSIGYGVGLWQVLALVLQIHGMDYRLVFLLTVIGGGIVGALNALLIEMAQVDAFIATLATGQVIYSISYWVTGGQQVIDLKNRRSPTFNHLGTWSLFHIPGTFLFAIILAALMFITLEYLPIGRYMYAVGANPKAAELMGIKRSRYVYGAMISSGIVVGIAGYLLCARQLGNVQSNIGPDYLLPALTAAFIGSTTIRPGRVNSIGTVVGIFIAVIGISGLLQLFPNSFFLTPLFNGLTLVIAITIASVSSRKRRNKADTSIPDGKTSDSDGDGKNGA